MAVGFAVVSCAAMVYVSVVPGVTCPVRTDGLTTSTAAAC
jgi:hypothetical protein